MGMAQEACSSRLGQKQVFRQTGVQIRDNGLHRAGIGVKGVVIEGKKTGGDRFVGELQTEIGAVFGVCQIAQAHISGVIGVSCYQLQVAAGLTGQIADSVCQTGGNTDGIVRHGQIEIQKGVTYAGGENGPQGAALQDQAGLHRASHPFNAIRQDFFGASRLRTTFAEQRIMLPMVMRIRRIICVHYSTERMKGKQNLDSAGYKKPVKMETID